MCWKNILNWINTNYQALINNYGNNIQNEYIKDLADNLDYSFQYLKEINQERDKLSEQRVRKLDILNDKLFLELHSDSGNILIIVSQDSKEAKIISVNQTFYRILEYLPQDVIGQDYSSINIWVNNLDPITIQNLLKETQVIKQQLFQFRTKSGTIKDFLLSAEEIDIEGKSVIVYIASDVSKITQNSCLVTYRCLNDPDWTMKYMSYDCEKLTGYKREEIIGNKKHTFTDVIHQKDQQRVWEIVQQALEEKIPYEIRYRINTKTGKIKWVWERGQGIFSNNNQLEALEGLIEDITELKKGEEKLLQKSENLREQIQQTINGLQNNNSGLDLVQKIPVFLDALKVETIADIAELTQKLMPENITDDIEAELYLTMIALSKVTLNLQLYQAHQVINEPEIQEQILFDAKKDLKAVIRKMNNLPNYLQVLINQIIIRWESIINSSEET